MLEVTILLQDLLGFLHWDDLPLAPLRRDGTHFAIDDDVV